MYCLEIIPYFTPRALVLTLREYHYKTLSQELDLSNNRLSELSITDALTSCPTLQSITLKGNPICLMPHYRLVVASLIGTLVVLDGTGVDMQVPVTPMLDF